MKNTKPLIILVFILACLHDLAFSQQITVTRSQREVLSSLTHMHKIFGHDRENFYVVKYTGTQFFLQKLDRELNPLLEESIKLFKGIKTYELESVFHFYDEIYVFVSRARISDVTLYYQKLDKDNLKPLSELIEITTIKNINGNWADFHFALSKEETKLLIACRTKLVWSGAQFNEFYVFGEQFELVWKHKDAMEFQGQGPRDNLYLVDETGNVSILSLLKRESIISLIRDVRNLYSIYRYTNDGNDFNEYPVTLNDRYIRGVKIIAGKDGELVCAGLYSEVFKSGIRGTFFFKIDAISGIVTNYQLNSFDEAMMEQLANMKEPMIRDEELISYVISDIVLRANGTIIIIAEQVFHQSYDTYNNLIVTSYNEDGEVLWTRAIVKNQNFSYTTVHAAGVDLIDYRAYVREAGYMNLNIENLGSYALMAPVDKTGIIIYYNDNVKNLDSTEELKALNQGRKSYLLAIAIDEFGSITETPLDRWKKKELFPEPMRYYDTLSDTIVIPGFRNRSIDYRKITADAIP